MTNLESIRVDFNPQDSVPEALGIIISAPTGILYGNQCGGLVCLYEELEGYLVIVGQAKGFVDFFAKFRGRPPIGLNEWSESDLVELASLVSNEVFYFVRDGDSDARALVALDLANADSLTEAWIPVQTGDRTAALVFVNSD